MVAFLPPEIWHQILGYAALEIDSCALWTSARQVSREWRSTIARVYADIFLRDPTRCMLLFDTDTSIDVQMIFHRYADGNGSRCMFKFQEQDDIANIPSYMAQHDKLRYLHEKYSAVERSIQRYLGDGRSNRRFDLTPHIVCIGGKYMDSDLPELSFDSEQGVISFDWEAMLANFFLEAMALSRRDFQEARRISARFQEDQDFLDDSENIASLMDILEGAQFENLREIRRQRIGRYYGGQQELGHQDAKLAVIEENHRVARIRSASDLVTSYRNYSYAGNDEL